MAKKQQTKITPELFNLDLVAYRWQLSFVSGYLYKAGKITPLTGSSFKSNEISEAHQFLESGKSTGKITVEW